MGLKTLNTVLGIAGAAVLVLAAWALCGCLGRGLLDQYLPEQYQQARRAYRHTNTLVKGIEARNQGKPFDQWKPGDQDMHRHRTRQLGELLQAYPRLAEDAEANALIQYYTGAAEQDDKATR